MTTSETKSSNQNAPIIDTASNGQTASPEILKNNPISPTSGDPLSNLKESVHYVLIVLFVGLCALLVTVIFGAGGFYVTYMAQQQATFENLKNQILLQNNKIDNLTIEIDKLSNQPVSKK